MSNDNIEDYKNIILQYCNRIIREKCMSIYKKYEDGKLVYSIQFYQPEWFTELDDDLKHNIIISLQNHYTHEINALINKDMKTGSLKRKHNEMCMSEHCDC